MYERMNKQKQVQRNKLYVFLLLLAFVYSNCNIVYGNVAVKSFSTMDIVFALIFCWNGVLSAHEKRNNYYGQMDIQINECAPVPSSN